MTETEMICKTAVSIAAFVMAGLYCIRKDPDNDTMGGIGLGLVIMMWTLW